MAQRAADDGPGNARASGGRDSPASRRRAVRRRLWDPIARHLGGASRVFVVPDSALNLLPISAPPSPRGGYLLEHAPVIHYLSAERDLVAPEPARGRPRSEPAGDRRPAFSTARVFAALRSLPPGRAELSQRTAPDPRPTCRSTLLPRVPAPSR